MAEFSPYSSNHSDNSKTCEEAVTSLSSDQHASFRVNLSKECLNHSKGHDSVTPSAFQHSTAGEDVFSSTNFHNVTDESTKWGIPYAIQSAREEDEDYSTINLVQKQPTGIDITSEQQETKEESGKISSHAFPFRKYFKM